MVHSRANGHDKIHQALKKLKDESNAKELELIELISSMYEKVKDAQDKAVDTVRDTASTINTSVHLHPWHYIGGTAVGAFLLGMLIRRCK